MNAWRLLAGLLFAVIALSAPAADRYLLAPGEHWLAATVDHRDRDLTVLVYQPPSGEPWLRVIDLDQLGLRYAADRFRRHRSENYVLPDALTDYEAHVDPLAERIHFVTRVRPHRPENTPADLLLDIRVNGVLIDQPQYVKNTGSDLVLPKETLEQLRVALPTAYGPFLEDDMPVHALAGELFHLSPERLYLEMTVRPELFSTTELSPQGDWRPDEVTDWTPSVILGYDLAGGEDNFGDRWQTGLADLAVSAGTVTCRSRHLYRSLDERATRLDSECVADWPSIPLSAGVGDNFTAPGTMRETVTYGGFWIGTDYSLQPYRNLQPSLIVDGNARLPSTLEIWMDQRLGLRQEIPPGPFIVDNLPAVTGSGELRAVLVNALGRQVLVSAPVYSDPRLLQPGVSDWRIETGRLRPGGLAGGDEYTERFAAAGTRTGITDWLTGEIHAEGTDAFTVWSASAAARVWRLGLVELGVSQSRMNGRAGEAKRAGYSYRGDNLHVSYRETRRDAGYVSLGYPQPGDAPSVERIASIGASAGWARLTLTGVERRFDADDAENVRLGNASLAFSLGDFGQLLFTATRNFSLPGSEMTYGAHLSIPLGRRGHAYHSVSDLRGNGSTSTGYSMNPPPGSGVGLQVVRDEIQDNERYFAAATFRGDAAVANVSAQTAELGDPSWAAHLNGAVIGSRAGIALARDEGDSFAMIETAAGVDDVGVLREHQPVTETNRRGVAVVPGLRPYQENRLALDVAELPLSSAITDSRLTLVPGRRSVVVADFGYRQEHQLLARLTLAGDGRQRIPAGSEITMNGTPAGLVGFDGTIYVVLPDSDDAIIEVRWATGSCVAAVPVSPAKGVQDAGEITCHPE